MDRNDVDHNAVADDLTSVTPDIDASPTTTTNSTVDLANNDGGINGNGNGNTSANANNRSNFGARFISGIFVALAEEVHDLVVEVDADPSTPLWDGESIQCECTSPASAFVKCAWAGSNVRMIGRRRIEGEE